MTIYLLVLRRWPTDPIDRNALFVVLLLAVLFLPPVLLYPAVEYWCCWIDVKPVDAPLWCC